MIDEQPDTPARDPASPGGGWNVLALVIGIAVALALTVYPHLATRGDGKADHLGLFLLLWAMSAGFIRGVGFVPRNVALRAIFSTSASVLALGAGIWWLATV